MNRVDTRPRNISAVERAGFALVLTLALVFSYRDPADSAAWLLLLLSFPMFLLDPSIRSDPGLRWAVWGVLLGHHVVALVFAYSGIEISIDADSFHSNAMNAAIERTGWVLAIDYELYTQLMAYLYRFAGLHLWGDGSRLLGAEFAVFTFALALLLFIKVLMQFNQKQFFTISVLLFGCAPSMLIHTSIPLRESMELALLLLYCILMFVYIQKPNKTNLLILFPVIMGFGVMHKGLILYTLILATLVLAYTAWLVKKKSADMSLLFTAVLVPLGMFAAIVVISKFDLRNSAFTTHLLSGKLLLNLQYGREILVMENPRSAFATDLDFSTVPAFIMSYIKVYVSYMFAPFVWQVENLKDLIAALESLLRFALLGGLLVGIVKKLQEPKALLLILVFVSMTMFWTLATTNYGQAFRHHVLTNWILIVIGLPCLMGLLGRLAGRVAPQEQPG